MPIKGLSDKMRLPRKGIIRIGEKDEKRGFPKAVDHFISPPEVQAIYGAAPKELAVRFPFETVEENYEETLKAYKSGGKLFCKGDGEKANRSDGQGGMLEIDCPYHDCEFFKRKECKAIGVLTFILPEVSISGAYQIWTSSLHSMGNIRATLTQMKRLFGKLSTIPMIVKVTMVKKNPWVKDKAGNKKQVTVEVPIISVECNLPLEEVKYLASLPAKSLDADTYPEDLHGAGSHVDDIPVEEGSVVDIESGEVIETVSEVTINPVAKDFLELSKYIEDNTGFNMIEKFMTVPNGDGGVRRPTIEMIKGWSSSSEIAYLAKTINAIKAEYGVTGGEYATKS